MKPKFEIDVANDITICGFLKTDPSFAKEFYTALCNIIWYSVDGQEYTASWRHAGEFVASLTDKDETYLDYYCSVPVESVSKRVEQELRRLGWRWRSYEDVTHW